MSVRRRIVDDICRQEELDAQFTGRNRGRNLARTIGTGAFLVLGAVGVSFLLRLGSEPNPMSLKHFYQRVRARHADIDGNRVISDSEQEAFDSGLLTMDLKERGGIMRAGEFLKEHGVMFKTVSGYWDRDDKTAALYKYDRALTGGTYSLKNPNAIKR